MVGRSQLDDEHWALPTRTILSLPSRLAEEDRQVGGLLLDELQGAVDPPLE